MSEIENKVVDNYKEHDFHQRFYATCSECFKERRLSSEVRAKAISQLGRSASDYRTDFSSWNNNPLG